MKKIVVIGGGTGTSVVLAGLKNYDVELTAVVAMADSGGSTGRLRDEFGFQPVGDLRQSLAALAREDSQEWVRKLLLYRFAHGEGLVGHNLGNLILTALQDMSGSTPKALEILESILKLKGKVYPSTDENIDLVIEYDDGTVIIGEDNLNPGKLGGKRIVNVKLSPICNANQKSLNAIRNADLIVIGPGDLYASIIPNFLVKGINNAILTSSAKSVYILNLMSRFTQTHGYKASDYIEEITKYCVKKPDYIIINNGQIEKKILTLYAKENEFPIENDVIDKDYNIIESDLISIIKTNTENDTIHRSLLRHDENKLAKLILSI